MTNRKNIFVLRGDQKEEAWLDINERRLTILLTLSNGWSKTYTGVNIFDYDDQDIISDPQLQKDYFFLWMESIRDVDE